MPRDPCYIAGSAPGMNRPKQRTKTTKSVMNWKELSKSTYSGTHDYS